MEFLKTVLNIDINEITNLLTALGGLVAVIAGYVMKLLHKSAKDSKTAAESMKVDFSDLNDEFKILMDNQEELLKLAYEIKGSVQGKVLPRTITNEC